MKKHRNNPSEVRDFAPASNIAHQDPIGSQVGPYKLLSVLGEGGFGIVYLAEQKQPIRRQIALKVIKPGMDSKQVIGRFEAERQALALLDHPNISHIFDGGATESGHPYFVMEYVKGIPITEYCDEQKLNIEERLELFQQVCEAVQHAHQKGIIHRDIKPSNILVSHRDGKPLPMIIDFGVAKAISQPLTEKTLFTEQGQFIGTPEYMSPEQAGIKIQDIDTRSDVYSLGVVLYELLSGSLPFDPKTLRQAAFGEIQRIIREEEPPRPSTQISTLGDSAAEVAQKRRVDVKKLVRRLHNELEWIPLTAIRKEPDRRYKTTSELADDVRNYLNGDPLIAGPESMMYRLRKVAKRHQALTGGIVAVLAVLIVGIIVSTIFAIGQARERRRAEAAEALAGERLDDVQRITTSMHNLASQYVNQGKYQEAELLCLPTLEIRKRVLGEEHPSTLSSLDNLAYLYRKQGRYEEAELLYRKILETRKRVLGEEHPETLSSMNNLGLLYRNQGRYEEAEPLYLKALEAMKRMLGEKHPSTLRSMITLASLYRNQSRYEEAEPLTAQLWMWMSLIKLVITYFQTKDLRR